jgi:hypothetical protein
MTSRRCEAADVCVEKNGGADCVDASLTPRDSKQWIGGDACSEDGRRVLSCGYFGYVESDTCGTSEVCVDGGQFAGCVDASLTPCTLSEPGSAGCSPDKHLVLLCDHTLGYLSSYECAPGQVCIDGQTGPKCMDSSTTQ